MGSLGKKSSKEHLSSSAALPPRLRHERVHASQSRLGFLDWTRGLAAAIMLQGHVFHSFIAKDLREGSTYILSQFIGGLPPAFFLFLTGVTLGFLMDSLTRKEPSFFGRLSATLGRARFLIGIALLFRLQLWLFAYPLSPWTDLLKVDVLNCMGLTVAVLSLMVAFDTRERVTYAAVIGLVIACASPLISAVDWPLYPELVKNYLAPNANFFSFFPWASFLAFGLSAGSILRLTEAGEYDRLLQWSAIFGGALILAANFFSNIPYSLYAKSDFWLDSPGLVFVKTGVILITLGVAHVWMTFHRGQWSWIATLGQNSLIVYWVHIELVYGRWFGSWKESLGVAQTTLMAALIIGLMVLLAEARLRYDRGDFPGLRLRLMKLWPIGA